MEELDIERQRKRGDAGIYLGIGVILGVDVGAGLAPALVWSGTWG